MRRNIYAFTPVPDSNDGCVPYISINAEEDGSVSIHVRGEAYETGEKAGEGCITPGAPMFTNDQATITLPPTAAGKAELCMMFCALGEFLYGADVMAATGKHIMGLVMAGANVVDDAANEAVDEAIALSEEVVAHVNGKQEFRMGGKIIPCDDPDCGACEGLEAAVEHTNRDRIVKGMNEAIEFAGRVPDIGSTIHPNETVIPQVGESYFATAPLSGTDPPS